MRTTDLITISLPPKMAAQAEKIAKKQHMTRSELLRTALRRYFEEVYIEEIVRTADEELRAGKAKVLPPGGLTQLLER